MVVVTNRENVIVVVGANLNRSREGVVVDEILYPAELGLSFHVVGSIPIHVRPMMHCFDGSSFYLHPTFEAQEIQRLKEENTKFKEENEMIKGVLDELLLGGVV